MSTSPTTTKILILVADPSDQARLRLGREVQLIRQSHRLAAHRDDFALEFDLAVGPGGLQQALLDVRPQVVHFSGHGAGPGGLVLEDPGGPGRLVSTDALAELFRLLKDDVQCVVLNSCLSAVQAAEIVRHIPYVIGMTHEIGDAAALHFSAGFYDALFRGEPHDRAFAFGCNAIQLNSLPPAVQTQVAGRGLTTGGTGVFQALPEHLKPILYFQPEIYIRCHEKDDPIVRQVEKNIFRASGLRVGGDYQFREGSPAPYVQDAAIRNSRHVFVIWSKYWSDAAVLGADYTDPRLRILLCDASAPPPPVPAAAVADLTVTANRVDAVVRLFRDLGFPEAVINKLLAGSAKQGIEELGKILASPPARAAVGLVTTNLGQAREHLVDLAKWKRLHDHLHAISVALPGLADPYERLKKVVEKIDEDVDPADREQEIEEAWGLVQGVLLRTLLPALRILTQDAAKIFRPGQISWLANLQRSQRQLDETSTDSNLRTLRLGVAGLEPVIDTAMVQVNTTLFNTASNVPLGVLVEELDRIADLLRSADLLPDQVPRLQMFERGIVALQRLHARLTGLVDVHNYLQTMDAETKPIEGPTVSADDVEAAWQGMEEKAAELAAVPGEDWLAGLCRLIDEVAKAIKPAQVEPVDRRALSRLRNAFGRYRSQLVTDFQNTDLKLVEFVDDLQVIRVPLEKAIEGLQS